MQYLAADAGVGAVAHDARDRILRVGVHRAALQAGRLEAVVAAHRQVVLRDRRKEAALDVADAPPVDFGGVAVLLVAGHDAALAADALPHVEVESVLLAGLERARRHARRRAARDRAAGSGTSERRHRSLRQREGHAVFGCPLSRAAVTSTLPWRTRRGSRTCVTHLEWLDRERAIDCAPGRQRSPAARAGVEGRARGGGPTSKIHAVRDSGKGDDGDAGVARRPIQTKLEEIGQAR